MKEEQGVLGCNAIGNLVWLVDSNADQSFIIFDFGRRRINDRWEKLEFIMNTNDTTSKTASQTTGVLTQPLPAAGVPTINYAIAMQQYQFQQSLVTQQLLAEQQAVAHAVSIKAAAEQAAARAAEISRLLQGEKIEVPKENADLGSKR